MLIWIRNGSFFSNIAKYNIREQFNSQSSNGIWCIFQLYIFILELKKVSNILIRNFPEMNVGYKYIVIILTIGG